MDSQCEQLGVGCICGRHIQVIDILKRKPGLFSGFATSREHATVDIGSCTCQEHVLCGTEFLLIHSEMSNRGTTGPLMYLSDRRRRPCVAVDRSSYRTTCMLDDES